MATHRAPSEDDASDPPASHDARVDDYIAAARPFARPILAHLRGVVHAACPGVDESMKWSMPFFVYRGNLCHMAAFNAHCAFGFWREKELPALPARGPASAMGSLGRIVSLDDLPPRRVLTSLVEAAAKLNEGDTKPVRAATKRAPLAMPDDFDRALAAHQAARTTFDAFTPGARRDYIEWIVEAKRDATRAARIATAVEWIADGKTRHWKYQKC